MTRRKEHMSLNVVDWSEIRLTWFISIFEDWKMPFSNLMNIILYSCNDWWRFFECQSWLIEIVACEGFEILNKRKDYNLKDKKDRLELGILRNFNDFSIIFGTYGDVCLIFIYGSRFIRAFETHCLIFSANTEYSKTRYFNGNNAYSCSISINSQDYWKMIERKDVMSNNIIWIEQKAGAQFQLFLISNYQVFESAIFGSIYIVLSLRWSDRNVEIW